MIIFPWPNVYMMIIVLFWKGDAKKAHFWLWEVWNLMTWRPTLYPQNKYRVFSRIKTSLSDLWPLSRKVLYWMLAVWNDFDWGAWLDNVGVFHSGPGFLRWNASLMTRHPSCGWWSEAYSGLAKSLFQQNLLFQQKSSIKQTFICSSLNH